MGGPFRSERPGDFIEQRVLLDGLRQLLHAKIHSAQSDALTLRVVAEPVQGARLAAGAVPPCCQPKVE